MAKRISVALGSRLTIRTIGYRAPKKAS
jgi:hypothetical protein